MGHKRTNPWPLCGASSSARSEVPSRNEIEFRDDANRLPASTQRASPVDLTPIEQGTAEPPKDIAMTKSTPGARDAADVTNREAAIGWDGAA
jgi:hypothetical protein